jgi:hypothetical protein
VRTLESHLALTAANLEITLSLRLINMPALPAAPDAGVIAGGRSWHGQGPCDWIHLNLCSSNMGTCHIVSYLFNNALNQSTAEGVARVLDEEDEEEDSK